jgi:hypothetical protein
MSWIRSQQALRGSRFRKLVTWAADSRFLSVYQSLTAAVATAVRESWLYNWLTAEPDAEVIIIDLRQTRTVGPVISIVEGVTDALAPQWHQSRLKRGVQWLGTVGKRLAATRVGQFLVYALTPPEVIDHKQNRK